MQQNVQNALSISNDRFNTLSNQLTKYKSDVDRLETTTKTTLLLLDDMRRKLLAKKELTSDDLKWLKENEAVLTDLIDELPTFLNEYKTAVANVTAALAKMKTYNASHFVSSTGTGADGSPSETAKIAYWNNDNSSLSLPGIEMRNRSSNPDAIADYELETNYSTDSIGTDLLRVNRSIPAGKTTVFAFSAGWNMSYSNLGIRPTAAIQFDAGSDASDYLPNGILIDIMRKSTTPEQLTALASNHGIDISTDSTPLHDQICPSFALTEYRYALQDQLPKRMFYRLTYDIMNSMKPVKPFSGPDASKWYQLLLIKDGLPIPSTYSDILHVHIEFYGYFVGVPTMTSFEPLYASCALMKYDPSTWTVDDTGYVSSISTTDVKTGRVACAVLSPFRFPANMGNGLKFIFDFVTEPTVRKSLTSPLAVVLNWQGSAIGSGTFQMTISGQDAQNHYTTGLPYALVEQVDWTA